MGSFTAVEAYEVLVHARRVHQRVLEATETLRGREGLAIEKEWLAAAAQCLGLASDCDVMEGALSLRELAGVREETADERRDLYVDTLERLVAGITFHAGARSPLIEALFPKLKLPALRRGSREALGAFQRELEKRLQMSYVKRLLGEPELAPVEPVIEQTRAAFLKFEEAYSGPFLADSAAAELKGRLVSAAARTDLKIRQARLLAEAALAPLEGAFEASLIGAKAKRRVSSAGDEALLVDSRGNVGAASSLSTNEVNDHDGSLDGDSKEEDGTSRVTAPSTDESVDHPVRDAAREVLGTLTGSSSSNDRSDSLSSESSGEALQSDSGSSSTSEQDRDAHPGHSKCTAALGDDASSRSFRDPSDNSPAEPMRHSDSGLTFPSPQDCDRHEGNSEWTAAHGDDASSGSHSFQALSGSSPKTMHGGGASAFRSSTQKRAGFRRRAAETASSASPSSGGPAAGADAASRSPSASIDTALASGEAACQRGAESEVDSDGAGLAVVGAAGQPIDARSLTETARSSDQPLPPVGEGASQGGSDIPSRASTRRRRNTGGRGKQPGAAPPRAPVSGGEPALDPVWGADTPGFELPVAVTGKPSA